MGDAAAELDALAADEPPPKPAAKPKATAKPGEEPPKPASVAKPGDKPAEATPPAADPDEPVKINDLRTTYRELKKKVQTEYEPKLQQVATLEARIKELEGANPPEVKILQEKLTAAESRRNELEEKVALFDYRQTSEFLEKHQKPYLQQWARARKDLAEISVELPNGESRVANDQDLVELLNLPLGRAQLEANKKFGDLADAMMRHRERILDLVDKQDEAVAEATKRAMEKTKLDPVQAKANAERVAKDWTAANTAIVEKWPKMFGKIDDDPDGNALLEKGLALADRLFSPTPDTQPKNEAEALRLHAMIRQKVANHDRLALWHKRDLATIAELRAALDEYEKSDPNGGLGGGPSGGGTGGFLEDANAELDALDRKGT